MKPLFVFGVLLASTFATFAQDPAPAEKIQRVNVAESKELKISTDQPSYRHGDQVKLTVEIAKEGHLRVYGVNYDNSTTLLFPNNLQKDDHVTPGTITLPPAGLEIFVTLEKGQSEITEHITAVYSPEPFSDSGPGAIRFPGSGYVEVGVTTSEGRKSRGLVPTARAKSASAELEVQIKK